MVRTIPRKTGWVVGSSTFSPLYQRLGGRVFKASMYSAPVLAMGYLPYFPNLGTCGGRRGRAMVLRSV